MIFWKLIKNIALGTGTPFRDRKSLRTKQTQVKLNAKRSRLAHKSSHPHPTAAEQNVPKISLDPHLTKYRWGIPILSISMLCWWCIVRHQLLSSGSLWTNSVAFRTRYTDFHTRKCLWKCRMQNGSLVKTQWDVINLYCDIKWWSFTDIPLNILPSLANTLIFMSYTSLRLMLSV